MSTLQEWIEKVNAEEFKHPEKTFGNKPSFPNQLDIAFLQNLLKELSEIQKEAKEVVSVAEVGKAKIRAILSNNNAHAGKIF